MKVTCVKTLYSDEDIEFASMSLSQYGKYVASGIIEIQIWDITSGKCVKTLEGHKDWISSISYSPDGRYLASSSFDKSTKIWDVKSGKCIRTLENIGLSSKVLFSPNGRYLLIQVASGYYQIMDLKTNKYIVSFSGVIMIYSPNNLYLALGKLDGSIILWNLKTGNNMTIKAHYNSVSALSFSLNDKYLASGSLSADKTNIIKIWDTKTGTCIKVLQNIASCYSIAFSPFGLFIVEDTFPKQVNLWKYETGEYINIIDNIRDSMYFIYSSLDSYNFITESKRGNYYIKFWHVEDYNKLTTQLLCFDKATSETLPEELIRELAGYL